VIRENLDRSNAAKFGEDFAHLVESLSYTLRTHAGMDAYNPSKDGANDGGDGIFDFLTLLEMRNVFDLLRVYEEVNQAVIKERPKSKEFVEFTAILQDIKELLLQVRLEETDPGFTICPGPGAIPTSIW